MNTEHKFEPFDRVLVRDDEGDPWRCSLFSHESKYKYRFDCTGECQNHMIPYTPETAHLLGTSQPYEPPKPPHEYKWGDRVIVDCFAGKNTNAIYLGRATNGDILFIIEDDSLVRQTAPVDILRPLEPSHD